MTLGQEIIKGLTKLRDVLRSGGRLSDHFKVTTRRLTKFRMRMPFEGTGKRSATTYGQLWINRVRAAMTRNYDNAVKIAVDMLCDTTRMIEIMTIIGTLEIAIDELRSKPRPDYAGDTPP